jgi:Sec-independent protein translocase protein TatA
MPCLGMLAFIFNFGPFEFVIVLVVAILVFGKRLPAVAVQAATAIQKARRSLADLRRETGIDEELRKARREIENAVPRDLGLGKLDVPKIIEHEIKKALDPEEIAEASEPKPEPPPESDGSVHRPDAPS